MKEKMVFIGKFLLFSAILFIIWIYIGRYYLIFLAQVSTPILYLLGYQVSLVVNEQIMFTFLGSEMILTDSYLNNYNIVPFVALVLATSFNKDRIIKTLLIGLPIIFLFHLIDLIAHFPLYYYGDGFAGFLISISAITRMLIPFLIWFALSYDYILHTFRIRKKTYQCPICKKTSTGIMMHIKDSHKKIDDQQQKKIGRFIEKYPELKDMD